MHALIARLPYGIRNLRHRARGLKAEICHLANVGVLAELEATVIRKDGTRQRLGVVSRRVVTDAAAAFIADAFRNLTELESFNFHDSGTGTTAEAASQTALVTPFGGARVSGTQSAPTAPQYRTVATIPYTSTLAITEHAVFSASTTGTMLDRSVFAAVNVVSGESVQFTYTLTIAAGG
jgi:hypothetical protein